MAYNPRNRETRIDLASAGSQRTLANDTNAKPSAVEEPQSPDISQRLKKRKYEPPLPPMTSQRQQQIQSTETVVLASASESYLSPWKTYERLYTLQFGNGDYFIVAEMKIPVPDENPVVIVKTFAGSSRDSIFEAIQRIQHPQFVSARRFFAFGDSAFTAFEFMPLSLSEIAGHPLMNDIRLASILGQIVDGLVYLEQKGLEHTQLNCCNILVDLAGNVKIWGQEHVRSCSSRGAHTKALGLITMELVQGYVKEDGNLGLERPEDCLKGVAFLSATECAVTATELTGNPLLCLPWHKRRIAGLVSLANIWAERGFTFSRRGRMD